MPYYAYVMFILLYATYVLVKDGFFFWEPEISGDVYLSASGFWSNYSDMYTSFKFYVYHPDGDDQTTFDRKIISGANASEACFFENLKASYFFRTNHPQDAHLFFIPIPCHKKYEKIRWCDTGSGKFPGKGYLIDSMRSTLMKNHPYKAHVFYSPVSCHLKPQKEAAYEEMGLPILERYEKDVFPRFPYWNRTLGINPFFLICHEIDPRVTEEVPLLTKNSIRVVCSPGNKIGFIPYKDITLPPAMQLPTAAAGGRNTDQKRTTLGYWEGICDTYISKTLVETWEGDGEVDVRCAQKYKDGRPEKFRAAQFCICPGGSSKCITMAIHYGCVPVILAAHSDLPFDTFLDWQKISITVNEDELSELREILEAKAETEFTKLHRNLIKVQRHFQWNTPPVSYDAFHMVLYELYLEAQSCKRQKHHSNKPLKHTMPSYRTMVY